MPADGEPKRGVYEVYYDGSCPMCTAFAENIEGSSKKDAFVMKDITKDALPEGFVRDRVEREIHVVAPDGRVRTNADAVLEILSTYPRWRFIARIGRLPVISGALRIAYDFVARHRRTRIARFVARAVRAFS